MENGGLIDRSGTWRIYPQFENGKRFSEGLVAVMPEIGYINQAGGWVFTLGTY